MHQLPDHEAWEDAVSEAKEAFRYARERSLGWNSNRGDFIRTAFFDNNGDPVVLDPASPKIIADFIGKYLGKDLEILVRLAEEQARTENDLALVVYGKPASSFSLRGFFFYQDVGFRVTQAVLALAILYKSDTFARVSKYQGRLSRQQMRASQAIATLKNKIQRLDSVFMSKQHLFVCSNLLDEKNPF